MGSGFSIGKDYHSWMARLVSKDYHDDPNFWSTLISRATNIDEEIPPFPRLIDEIAIKKPLNFDKMLKYCVEYLKLLENCESSQQFPPIVHNQLSAATLIVISCFIVLIRDPRLHCRISEYDPDLSSIFPPYIPPNLSNNRNIDNSNNNKQISIVPTESSTNNSNSQIENNNNDNDNNNNNNEQNQENNNNLSQISQNEEPQLPQTNENNEQTNEKTDLNIQIEENSTNTQQNNDSSFVNEIISIITNSDEAPEGYAAINIKESTIKGIEIKKPNNSEDKSLLSQFITSLVKILFKPYLVMGSDGWYKDETEQELKMRTIIIQSLLKMINIGYFTQQFNIHPWISPMKIPMQLFLEGVCNGNRRILSFLSNNSNISNVELNLQRNCLTLASFICSRSEDFRSAWTSLPVDFVVSSFLWKKDSAILLSTDPNSGLASESLSLLYLVIISYPQFSTFLSSTKSTLFSPENYNYTSSNNTESDKNNNEQNQNQSNNNDKNNNDKNNNDKNNNDKNNENEDSVLLSNALIVGLLYAQEITYEKIGTCFIQEIVLICIETILASSPEAVKSLNIQYIDSLPWNLKLRPGSYIDLIIDVLLSSCSSHSMILRSAKVLRAASLYTTNISIHSALRLQKFFSGLMTAKIEKEYEADVQKAITIFCEAWSNWIRNANINNHMVIVALKKNVLKKFAANEYTNTTGAIDRLILFSDAIRPFLKQNVVENKISIDSIWNGLNEIDLNGLYLGTNPYPAEVPVFDDITDTWNEWCDYLFKRCFNNDKMFERIDTLDRYIYNSINPPPLPIYVTGSNPNENVDGQDEDD